VRDVDHRYRAIGGAGDERTLGLFVNGNG